jgi:hypothetical protein
MTGGRARREIGIQTADRYQKFFLDLINLKFIFLPHMWLRLINVDDLLALVPGAGVSLNKRNQGHLL